MGNGEILNSWKEIATYVGRGVRTVQRWEQELNLPVRRPRGKQRSAVIALKHDIDIWLRLPHQEKPHIPGAKRRYSTAHRQNHERLLNNTKLLIFRTNLLLAQSDKLQKQIARAISIGSALRSFCATPRTSTKNPVLEREALSSNVSQVVTLEAPLQSSFRRDLPSPK